MAVAHRARFPELWTPRRQPRGQVRVNRDHPLAMNLIGFWAPGLFRWNQINGAALTATGTPGVAIGAHGIGLYSANTSNSLGQTFGTNYGVSGTTNVTLAALIHPQALGISGGAICSVGTSSTTPTYLTVNSSGVPVYFDGGRTSTGGSAISNGSAYTILGTSVSFSIVALYLDGASFGSAGGSPTAAGQRDRVTIGGFPGIVSAVWLWDRAFSASEAAMHHADPYGMLLPA